MRKFFLFILSFFALHSEVFALTPEYSNQQERILTIAADSWCPINCSSQETRLGVGIDLAKAIFEPLGYSINYKVMPWSDALRAVQAGRVDAVIGASRYDSPSLIFPRQAVYNVSDDFYVQKGNSWRFQGVHTLKGMKLGVIQGYGYGPTISGYIASNRDQYDKIQAATGEHALNENIRKLLGGQIDVIVEARPVMEYHIMKMKLDQKIGWAGSAPQAQVYLAFSPALPGSRGLAAAFDAGMQKLSASGRLEGFYSSYGLSSFER